MGQVDVPEIGRREQGDVAPISRSGVWLQLHNHISCAAMP